MRACPCLSGGRGRRSQHRLLAGPLVGPSVRRSVVAQTQLSSDRPVQVGDGAVAATTTDGGDDDDDLLTLRCAWESLAAVGGSGELWQEGSRVGAVAVERPSDGRTEAVGLCVCVRR